VRFIKLPKETWNNTVSSQQELIRRDTPPQGPARARTYTWQETLELKVNIGKPMSRDTGLLRAEGKLVAGRTTAVAEGRLVGEAGKVCARTRPRPA
jgi:acyl-coenzyme A thioesterase PaaI-like protein